MSVISTCLEGIVQLFQNDYMFSLLGLIGLSVVFLTFKILVKF